MHQPDEQQRPTAAPYQGHDGPRVRPGVEAAPRELGDAVPDQHREQGICPPVDQHELHRGDRGGQRIERGGVAADAERMPVQQDVGVRQGDEQQHPAAGEVRREGPRGGGGGTGVGRAGHARQPRSRRRTGRFAPA